MKLDENESQQERGRGKRLAVAAFLFFLFKGLAWLAAGTGLTLLAW